MEVAARGLDGIVEDLDGSDRLSEAVLMGAVASRGSIAVALGAEAFARQAAPEQHVLIGRIGELVERLLGGDTEVTAAEFLAHQALCLRELGSLLGELETTLRGEVLAQEGSLVSEAEMGLLLAEPRAA
jgi:hypothetical protein